MIPELLHTMVLFAVDFTPAKHNSRKTTVKFVTVACFSVSSTVSESKHIYAHAFKLYSEKAIVEKNIYLCPHFQLQIFKCALYADSIINLVCLVKQ